MAFMKNAPGLSTRMSKNAGKKSVIKSAKGHFAAAAQKVAKLRNSGGDLQHGVPKHAPVGAKGIGGTKVPGKSKKVQATEAQTALNPEQQGRTNKKDQTRSDKDDTDAY